MTRAEIEQKLDLLLSASISYAMLDQKAKEDLKSRFLSYDDDNLLKVVEIYEQELKTQKAADEEDADESSRLMANLHKAAANLKKSAIKVEENNSQKDSEDKLNHMMDELNKV